jgi:hypothetical protein
MGTVWHVETGIATGRSFATDGFMDKFKTWVDLSAGYGPAWFIIDDQSAGSDPYIVISDVAAAGANDISSGPSGLPAKFIKIGYLDSEAGFIRMQHYLYWNTSTHVGYGVWQGKRVATYDAAQFEYRFRGGYIGMMVSARLASTWTSAGVLDWEGDPNRVEGVGIYGINAGLAVAGTNVVLNVSNATSFTLDNYYYIFDFQDVSHVNYVKVVDTTNAGSGQITVDALTYNFPGASVICAYAHRFFGFGNSSDAGINNFGGSYGGFAAAYSNGNIPYVSANDQANVFHDQASAIFGAVGLQVMDGVLSCENPNDAGLQAVMRPFVYEYSCHNAAYASKSVNRSYGQVKGLYSFFNNSYVRGSDAKTVGGKDYVFLTLASEICGIGGNGQHAAGFLDTISSV